MLDKAKMNFEKLMALYAYTGKTEKGITEN